MDFSGVQDALGGAAQQQPDTQATVTRPPDGAQPTSSAADASPTAQPSQGQAGAPTSAAEAPAAAPAGATPSPAATQPPPPKKGWGGSMLGGILSALGGTNEVSYHRATADDVTAGRAKQEGDMVAVKTVSGPGQQFKRIIAGALTGAAAGAGVEPGPGHLGRSASAGFKAGGDLAQNVDDRKRQHADQDFDANERVVLRKAQMAKLNQDISIGAFQLTKMKADDKFGQADRENEFAKSIREGGLGSRDLGVAATFEDVLKMNDNVPNLLQEHAHGNVIGVPHVENGVITGMHYALVTPQWKDAKLTQDQPFYTLVPSKDGKTPPTVQTQTVKAGTMTQGEFWAKQQAATKEVIDFQKQQMTNASEEKRTGMTAGATVQAAKIGAAGRKDVAAINAKSRESVAATRAVAKAVGPTAATRTMAETAPKVISLADKVLAGIDENEDQLGPVEGRWSEFMAGKIGSDNPRLIELRTNAKLLQTLLMRMHVGARGGVQLMQHFKELVDTGNQSPDNLRSSVGAIKSYAEDVRGMPPEQAAGATTPQTHVFSASAWLKGHPGGDVEAAKKAAAAQNYQVVD